MPLTASEKIEQQPETPEDIDIFWDSVFACPEYQNLLVRHFAYNRKKNRSRQLSSLQKMIIDEALKKSWKNMGIGRIMDYCWVQRLDREEPGWDDVR